MIVSETLEHGIRSGNIVPGNATVQSIVKTSDDIEDCLGGKIDKKSYINRKYSATRRLFTVAQSGGFCTCTL